MGASESAEALFERIVGRAVLPEEARASLLEALAQADTAGTLAVNPLVPSADLATSGVSSNTVVRRAERAALPLDIGPLTNPLRNLSPARRLGPFPEASGGLVHFDIYGPTHALHIDSGGVTLFAFTAARFRRLIRSAGAVTLDVQPGACWLASGLVSPGAPAGFLGLRVTDGKVTLPAGSTETDGRVDAGTAPNLVVDLELAPAGEPTLDPGACAGSAATTITAPLHLHLELHGGHLQKLVLTGGSATAAGQTFEFAEHQGPGRFVAELAAVLFDAAVAPSLLDLSGLNGSLMVGSGSSAITAAGWAVPLTQVPVSQLGDATGSGSWVLAFGAGTSARVDADGENEALRDGWLSIGQHSLALKAFTAPPPTERVLSLWALAGPNARPLPLRVRHPAGSVLLYVCDAHGEQVFMTGLAELRVDQPVEVNGQPIPLAEGGVVLSFSRQGTALRVTLYGFPGTDAAFKPSGKKQRGSVLSLRNALLWTAPASVYLLSGELDENDRVVSGSLVLGFGLLRWAPILPDPYVGSFAIRGSKEDRVVGALIATLTWADGGAASLAFTSRLPSPNVAVLEPSPHQSKPHPPDQGDVKAPSLPAGEPQDKTLPHLAGIAAAAAVSVPAPVITTAAPGPRLLDVSTNKDLIGVEWSLARQGVAVFGDGFSSGTFAPAVAGMDVQLPLAQQHVFMLPQVQWEPVRTLAEDQDPVTLGVFPSPLASASDGGATRIATQAPTLVPAIPDLVVDGVLDAFQSGATTAFATTLPFGIQAVVRLRATATGPAHADTLLRTEPVFTAPALRGGAQLTARAEGGRRKPGDESPGFAGQVVQRRNGVDLVSGVGLGLSVLGSTLDPASSVEAIFNEEFTTAAPRVPVTRFDLSGYGGSNFSDWGNPFGAFAQTTKVTFKVVVGRAFWELVKVATVLYPWGIHVTRSVTIERTSGGGVIRKDSGWQASSDGLFDFRFKPDASTPLQPSPYVVHPGLLRGLFDVARIRPTGGPLVEFPGSSGTVRLAPYYFDAEVELDDGVRSRATGVLGFLQLEPVGRPLDANELARLFELQGPIGGPLERTLDVGRSGFNFRASRVEADLALEAGARRLVGVLRGAVELPAVGSWSSVRLPGPTNSSAPREATPVDASRGVPLVRQQRMLDPVGGVMRLAASAGDYRFADAADLFAAANPAWDYGFLETNAACSFLFRRPHIVDGVAEARTTVPPSFVDIFARTTSKAVFPPLESTIEFPSAAHKLVVVPGGLKLEPSLNITPSRPALVLAEHGSDQIRLNYGAATVRYGLDEDGWSLTLTRLRHDSDMLGMTNFSRNEYDLVGSARTRPVVQRAQNFLFPDFEDALDFIPGFSQHPNFGPIELSPSNLNHEIKIVTRAEYDKDIDVGEVAVKIGCFAGAWVGWEIDSATGLTVPATGAQVGAELQVEIGLEPPFFIVFGLELEATLKQLVTSTTLSTEIEVDAYVGFGAKIHIGPFGGEAFLAVGVVVIWEDPIWKVGGLVRLHAELDLGIVDVSIDAELKGVVYCETPDRKCDYSGEVEVNVSICWVFHIDATYEASDTAVIGAC